MIICPKCQMQNVDGSVQCIQCGFLFPREHQIPLIPIYKNGQIPFVNNPPMNGQQFRNMNNCFSPNC